MLIVSSFKTPAGWLNVSYDEHYVHQAHFSSSEIKTSANTFMTERIAHELNAYFNDAHHRFQLPLKPQGSAYQLKVLNELLVIPAGRTMTYGMLATLLQSSPRAIGQACKRNPLVLFIPCHRVVGKDNVGGYMGQETALHYKLALLKHENPDLSAILDKTSIVIGS